MGWHLVHQADFHGKVVRATKCIVRHFPRLEVCDLASSALSLLRTVRENLVPTSPLVSGALRAIFGVPQLTEVSP